VFLAQDHNVFQSIFGSQRPMQVFVIQRHTGKSVVEIIDKLGEVLIALLMTALRIEKAGAEHGIDDFDCGRER
jgi:hypothetical protein